MAERVALVELTSDELSELIRLVSAAARVTRPGLGLDRLRSLHVQLRAARATLT